MKHPFRKTQQAPQAQTPQPQSPRQYQITITVDADDPRCPYLNVSRQGVLMTDLAAILIRVHNAVIAQGAIQNYQLQLQAQQNQAHQNETE